MKKESDIERRGQVGRKMRQRKGWRERGRSGEKDKEKERLKERLREGKVKKKEWK